MKPPLAVAVSALLALVSALPAAAAPPLPEEWLRAVPDARGPLEKADPRLLSPAAFGEEDLEVLATLRLPSEVLALGAGSPRSGARRALQVRLAEELEADYAPFGVRVERTFAFVPALLLRAPRAAAAALAGDPRIERVRPNGRVRALDAEGDGLMRVPELRAAGVDGAGVTIAVLDSGIDYGHPELPLGTKVVNLYDAIDHDGDARDGYGHGTPVAGIIAGLTTGVARGAKVAAVRVLDTRGEGSDAEVLEGIDAVLASVADGNPHAIRVVNLSLGGYFDDAAPPEPGRCDLLAPDYKAAFDLLAQAGILVVAASGNGGCTSGIVLPACVSNVLAVGAVYDAAVSPQAFGRGHCLPAGCSDSAPTADAIACYSDSGDRLDVLAPAHCVTAPRNGGGTHSCFGGTSAAAPYAAGVAALLFGAEPGRRPIEVKAALRDSGKAILDPRNGVTRNRIDAPAALAALRSAPAGTARAELFLPVVLDVEGVGGARFLSELTLTNRGTTAARLEATFTPATGMFPGAGGGGTVFDALAPGEQRVIPDAIAWLRTAKGLPIPTGPGQAGSLRLVFTGLSPATDVVSARVRTTAAACGGAAGLSYAAWRGNEGTAGSLRLFGLRSGPAERSNLAVVNTGTEGTVTPRIVLRSGDGASVYEVPAALLPPLSPGEWRQVNDADLLRAAGFAEATALVSRAAGTAPLGAYAVFNDNLSHDGSFVPAVPDDAFGGELVLPVVVETPTFESELVLFNPEAVPVGVSLTYTESLAVSKGRVGVVSIELAPFEQRILPRALDTLRELGLPLGPRGAASYAGTLQVLFASPFTTLVRGLAGSKTAAAGSGECAGMGSFGLFYTAVPAAPGAAVEAVVDGLRQTATTRSNLALFNPSATVPVTVAYDVHDGSTGAKVSSSAPVDLPPLGWTQVDRVLLGAGVTEGFVRVRRTSSGGVFGAYGVLNDGAAPGERTGDGSYVAGEAYDPPD